MEKVCSCCGKVFRNKVLYKRTVVRVNELYCSYSCYRIFDKEMVSMLREALSVYKDCRSIEDIIEKSTHKDSKYFKAFCEFLYVRSFENLKETMEAKIAKIGEGV